MVDAVLGECIWNLSYNERRMAIELELTKYLDLTASALERGDVLRACVFYFLLRLYQPYFAAIP